MGHGILPRIVERTSRGEEVWDIYSRLIKDNIIFIGGEINDFEADTVMATLLFMESQDPDKDISLYINSPGGSVTAGLAIFDTIKNIKPDVSTICIGQAASAAALILSSGTKGKRFALPHSRIMLHQPWGGAGGQASDIIIQANEINRIKKQINTILAENCSKPLEQIEQDTQRDFFLSPTEALEYGLIDKILKREDKK
ncbi:MAG: ATP-dependent Clp protease proteolytic subunit [Spirochaetes bacterium GWF1_31_7]|nr:MAG: ATP-dependent Clp protease proteolytic subunit [Spirochaetes bacterium GWE1_32_154]OHD46588.1 MAG: ATP-dependent Clp protease proteolytic subunit [Spirochaetes bacterium GWF1_31_7]OHD49388.1 MAG: ATP-dependent Clp protease proteolytic subunit [Spirochaetes bacterium GWE2_31_10]OHD83356.1 MAG: ATP-dependent Clp protease proteolytic subunit [Spirochaetes bacterium RIFOXYB1_FULL_32_8]HBD93108.1 ATP-dependent Clp protease proteolytic subunit [Spirochaetia bacterium]